MEEVVKTKEKIHNCQAKVFTFDKELKTTIFLSNNSNLVHKLISTRTPYVHTRAPSSSKISTVWLNHRHRPQLYLVWPPTTVQLIPTMLIRRCPQLQSGRRRTNGPKRYDLHMMFRSCVTSFALICLCKLLTLVHSIYHYLIYILN